MRPVYDYGIDGASEPTVFATLREAAATGRLRHAYVLLDFEDFWWPSAAPRRQSEAERRFLLAPDGRQNSARLWQRLDDIFLATLTLGSLEDSLHTVLAQHETSPILDLTPLGMTTSAAFEWEARLGGYYDLFAQKSRFAMRQALGELMSWRIITAHCHRFRPSAQ